MTLIGGAFPVLTSPCGPNCTYTITFDGPQVKCNSHMYNGTATIPISRFNGYSDSLPDWLSDWTPVDKKSWGDVYVNCPQGEVGAHCLVSSYYENLFFEWYSLDTSNTNITSNDTVAIYPRSVHRLECIPAYGKYTVNITFSNGIPFIKVSSTYIGSLVDLWRLSGRVMTKEGTADRWLNPQGLIKAANLFAVLTSFAQPLKGQIAGACSILVSRNGTLRIEDNSIYDGKMGGSVTLGKSTPQDMTSSAELILIQPQLIPSSWTRLSTQNASSYIINAIGRSKCSISLNTTSTRPFKTLR
jgi:hypothetical protein